MRVRTVIASWQMLLCCGGYFKFRDYEVSEIMQCTLKNLSNNEVNEETFRTRRSKVFEEIFRKLLEIETSPKIRTSADRGESIEKEDLTNHLLLPCQSIGSWSRFCVRWFFLHSGQACHMPQWVGAKPGGDFSLDSNPRQNKFPTRRPPFNSVIRVGVD